MRALLLSAVCLCAALTARSQSWQSVLASDGPDGRLEYTADSEGNRITDFSHAGYQGGGVPLPNVPTVERAGAVNGDATPIIQAALDRLAARAPERPTPEAVVGPSNWRPARTRSRGHYGSAPRASS